LGLILLVAGCGSSAPRSPRSIATSTGQALAYKVGQLAILALRAEAERALTDRFDPHAFHDVVLGLGPVSLSVLETEVRAWIAAQAS
jgi:uncharacterized protein (DUF885 family)